MNQPSRTHPAVADESVIVVSLDGDDDDVAALAAVRTAGSRIRAELVDPDQVRAPSAYGRFREVEAKNAFRRELRHRLVGAWTTSGYDTAQLCDLLDVVTNRLRGDGAVVFGDLVDRVEFGRFVDTYDRVMREHGSRSLLHSYVDLRNALSSFETADVSRVFLHPLLLVLIADAVGGPVKVVDARAKDAEPLSVLAQDNMLHIDNTPFSDEYKVIVTWERGRSSGPKGQNFVYLPGTHRVARNCFVDGSGLAWSSENASIFTTSEAVDGLLTMQQHVLGTQDPVVVEVQDPDRPMTSVFAAGSLVHHRFRTSDGGRRSSVIIAFHRTSDHPGRLLSDVTSCKSSLQAVALDGSVIDDDDFLDAIDECSHDVADALWRFHDGGPSVVLDAQAMTIDAARMAEWRRAATSAPRVEDLKRERLSVPMGRTLTRRDWVALVAEMMTFDKHGPLDLILYGDSREEPRKWARNRTREMRADTLRRRLDAYADDLRSPSVRDVLSLDEIHRAAVELHALAASAPTSAGEMLDQMPAGEARRSVARLVEDLGEAAMRTDGLQAFLSTSLFLFWAADDVVGLVRDPSRARDIAVALLNNYTATAVLQQRLQQRD